MSSLSLSLLGPFQAVLAGQPLHKFRTNKVQALLIYLAVEAAEDVERVHRREALMTLLWPDLPDQSAQVNLRQTLYRLRNAIPEVTARPGGGTVPFLLAERRTVQVNPAADYALDVAAFSRLLAPGLSGSLPDPSRRQQLERAVSLYQGDFLADFYLPDSDEFEEWASLKRAEFRRQVLAALETLTALHLDQATYDQAQAYARRQLEIDNLRESAYRQLMLALARDGQRSVALEQYQLCRQRLLDELDVEPEAETTDLYEQIRAEDLSRNKSRGAAEQQSSRAVSSSPLHPRTPAPRHNLPLQPTPFIGRADELAALDDLMADPDIRLITVVGPGGMGKTRLALAAAERQLARSGAEPSPLAPQPEPLFPDGVYFVPLAPLATTDHIPLAIAQALGFPPSGTSQRPETNQADLRPSSDQETSTPYPAPQRASSRGHLREGISDLRQALLDFLGRRQLLLLLDNFEHLLSTPAGPGSSSPALPAPPHTTDLLSDILQHAPAVQLLITSRERLNLREEQVYPIHGLAYPDWEAAAGPPAVETLLTYPAAGLFLQSARRVRPDFALAAGDAPHLARICRLVEGMPLGIELAAAWVDMLSLADIAAEIEGGLDFLAADMADAPERRRSMRAVFDASWARLGEAERTVFPRLALFRGGFSRAAAQQVAGASLRLLAALVNKSLLQYNQDRDRYELHELLRQYGADKLSQEEADETASRDRHSAYYCAWLEERAAALAGEDGPAALNEIAAEIENVQAAWGWAATRNHVARLGQALDGLSAFYQWSNRYQEGEAACRLAAAQFSLEDVPAAPAQSAPGDRARLLARILAAQADFNRALRETALARQLLDKSLTLLDGPALADQDTRPERAVVWQQMGWLAFEANQYDEARRLHEQSLALYQALGEEREAANVLNALGGMAMGAGRFQEARQRYEESLALVRDQANPARLAATLEWVGSVARDAGDYRQARQHFEESLALYQRLGNPERVASCLQDLSDLARHQGAFAAAADFLRQQINLAQEMDWPDEVAAGQLNLGSVLWLAGDFEAGHAHLAESLAGFQKMGRPRRTALAAVSLAEVEAHLGRYEAAAAAAGQALGQAREFGAQPVVGRAERVLGWLALARGEPAEAGERLQESVTLCRAAGDPEELAWSLAAQSRAAYGLGHQAEARAGLAEALRLTVESRAFSPLQFILPIAALALAGQGQVAQAADLYALAAGYPFVAGSPLFEDLIRQPLAALGVPLPPPAGSPAAGRQHLAQVWQAAEELLKGFNLA